MTEIRANYTFVGDDGCDFTPGKDYLAFELGGGLSVVNDQGRITSMAGPSEWWRVNDVKVDGTSVYERKEDEVTEGRNSAAEESDQAGGQNRQGRKGSAR